MLQCFALGNEALDSIDGENLSTSLVSLKDNPVHCRIHLSLNTVKEQNCSTEGAVVNGISSEAPLWKRTQDTQKSQKVFDYRR